MELIIGDTAAQAKAKAKAKAAKAKAKAAASIPIPFGYNQETAKTLAESLKMQVKVDRAYVWANCSIEQFQALKADSEKLAQFKFLFSFAGKRKQWMHRPLAESDIEGRKVWFEWENGVPVKLIGKAKAKAKAAPAPAPAPAQDKAINERLDRLEALIMASLEAK